MRSLMESTDPSTRPAAPVFFPTKNLPSTDPSFRETATVDMLRGALLVSQGFNPFVMALARVLHGRCLISEDVVLYCAVQMADSVADGGFSCVQPILEVEITELRASCAIRDDTSLDA